MLLIGENGIAISLSIDNRQASICHMTNILSSSVERGQENYRAYCECTFVDLYVSEIQCYFTQNLLNANSTSDPLEMKLTKDHSRDSYT